MLRRLLQYDNHSGAFRVSVTRTFKSGDFDPRSAALRNALHEYTVTRLFLLCCVTPPEMDEARMQRVAKEYFDIERASFMQGFKDVVGGASEQEHIANEVEFQVRRMRRRRAKLVAAAMSERDRLRVYLAALKRIELEADGDVTPADALTDTIVDRWRHSERWWEGMERPVARSTRQNTLLRKTMEIRRLVQWITEQRYGWTGRRTDKQRRGDTLGSPYSGHRPTSWREPSVVTVDHTVPQSWCGGTELVNIYASVRSDLCQIIPIPKVENSRKSNLPIEYIPVDADEQRPDAGLFDPRQLRTGDDFWTEARQAVSARQVLYTFLSYGLITESNDKHVSLEDRGPGCGFFSRERVRRHILHVVHENAAEEHERLINDVLQFVVRTGNPFVSNPRILTDDEFGSDFEALLKQRLEGETSFPRLIADAIRRSVAGFPGD